MEGFESLARVCGNREFGRAVLAYVRRVNVNVYDARMRRERGELSRDAIIKTDADGQEQIALRHSHVRCICPVHAEHPKRKRVRRWKSAQAHQSRCDRKM